MNLPGLPDGVSATVVTITVLSPKHAGYLTISPTDSNFGTSHMHWAAGQTLCETVFAWGDGEININNNGDGAEIAVDVTGYFR